MWKLDKQIHERKRNWLEHTERISSERASEQLLYQPIGRREPGGKSRDVSGRNGLTNSALVDDYERSWIV
jgi:hypothetical protein